MRKILALLFCLFLIQGIYSQSIVKDTVEASNSYRKAKALLENRIFDKLDTAIFLSQRAANIYRLHRSWDRFLNCLCVKMNAYAFQVSEEPVLRLLDTISQISIKKYGPKNLFLANAFNYIGLVNIYQSKIEEARSFFFKSLDIRRNLLDDNHADVAMCYNNIGNTYYLASEFENALEYYNASLKIRRKVFGEKHIDVASSYNNIGRVYFEKSEYDKAIEYFFKDFLITKSILGENHVDVAQGYNNIGNVYFEKSDYKTAEEYYQKALAIYRVLLGEKSNKVADCYSNLGFIFDAKSMYDKALEYFQKALKIYIEVNDKQSIEAAGGYLRIGITYDNKSEYSKALESYFLALSIYKEIFGEKHLNVAAVLNDIGKVFFEKFEFDKAIEFFYKSLNIKLELLEEKSAEVGNSYNSLGSVYKEKGEYEKSIRFFIKSLEIYKAISNVEQVDVAMAYFNLGNVFTSFGDLEKALDYHVKAYELRKSLLGEDHVDIAISLLSQGKVFVLNKKYDDALKFELRALNILKKMLGEKHQLIADCYNQIGEIFLLKKDYIKSLKNFHLGLYSNILEYSDSMNIYSNSRYSFSYKPIQVLLSFRGKALSFYELSRIKSKPKDLSDKKGLLVLSLKCSRNCDSIINEIRNTVTKQSDKIALGELSQIIYEEAIRTCIELNSLSNPLNSDNEYEQLAFYFSEQAKGMVLLQSMAEVEGIKYAKIPDSILLKEQSIKVEISFLEKKLAEDVDSTSLVQFRNNLFEANRQYELLVADYEKSYPEYFELKYSSKISNIKEIQKVLDKKTAIRSYFIGDSAIYICSITSKDVDLQQVVKITGFEDIIQSYRYALTGDPKFSGDLHKLGMILYKQLFPENSIMNKKIENLIIIPDGSLAFIPFESLPMGYFEESKRTTSTVSDSLRGFKNVSKSISQQDLRDFPFLINRFNISYAYSATLFYQNALSDKNKASKEKPSWLAIAPVFSDKKEGFATTETQELNRRIKFFRTDTLSTRGTLINGEYVNPLPGTEAETNSILNEFKAKGLNARVLLKGESAEKSIKSGLLENYRILHFATHGFVNSEKPELSGILLAQDSTGGQDGVLYSGELYNLKLNADLTVLSACETGLGKVKKGEGIIGLTRALLYAGSKNIIVSLWPVSDQSTSDLMIDFYKNLLNGKKSLSYSHWLRQAKLRMIKEGKYSHPFYWSPFILVGK